METTRRAIAKAVTWQLIGLVVMTAITYAITGSVAEGGLVAVVGAATGLATYVLHERVWSGIAWGRNFDALGASVAVPPPSGKKAESVGS